MGHRKAFQPCGASVVTLHFTDCIPFASGNERKKIQAELLAGLDDAEHGGWVSLLPRDPRHARGPRDAPPLEPTEVTFSLSPSYGIHGAREAHDWFLLMMGEKERRVLILVAFMRSPIHL